MDTSILAFIALFAASCTEKSEDTGDTGIIGDTAEPSDTAAPVDTNDPSKDTSDTGDSGSDTADSGEDSGDTAETPKTCEFEIGTSGGGKTTIGNELLYSLSKSSPSGATVPGYNEILRFNITSLHKDCDPLTISQMHIWQYVTDNAGTLWYGSMTRTVDLYNLSTDGLTAPALSGEVLADEDGLGGLAVVSGSLTIPPGVSYTIAVYVDTTGVSASHDDSIKAKVATTAQLEGLDTVFSLGNSIEGGTLVF